MTVLNAYVNNREFAALSYLALVPIVGVSMKTVRPVLWNFVRLFFLSRIGLAFALYSGVIVGAIYGMHRIGFWTRGLLGSSLLWFILVGLAWFFNITDAGKDSDFFKRRVVEALGISAALEVFVGLVVLPLWAEFAVQGVLTIVVLVNAIAVADSALKAAAKLTGALLALAGAALFVYTLVRFIQEWSTQNWRDVLNQFVLPLWLTVAGTPVLYAIAFVAGYESLVIHMSFWNDRRRPSFRALLGVAFELRGALVDINQFRGPSVARAASTSSFGPARYAVREWKRQRALDVAKRAESRRRLAHYAGVQGLDNDGLVLDRREFAETKAALTWLSTCHMGWYQRDDRPDSYRSDLLTMLGDFQNQGLPDPHGVVMRVRKDGQAWFAYRRTISGFVFGIGASAGPPSCWHWHGHRLPTGFPSAKSGWVSVLEASDPEWKEEDAV